MSTTKPVSLVSLNCYLIPSFFTYRQPWSAPSRWNQEARAKRIGEYIQKHDVVVLQEVWGSQVAVLEKELKESHVVPHGFSSYNIFGYLGNYIDSARFWLNQNGGLWFSYRKEISEIYRSKRTFATSETASKKGVRSMLLDMGSHWPGRYLLIFNTHLDPMNDNNKWLQCQEIKEFIGETIGDMNGYKAGQDRSSIFKTASSTFPFTSELVAKDFDWSKFHFDKCGVLVIGDFNSSSNSSLYKRIVELFNARDLYADYIKKNKQKEQPTFDYSKNSLAAIITGLKSRIDYIFAINTYSWPSSSSPEEKETKFMSLKCEEFKIQNDQRHGEELSDHWPLEVKLSPSSE